MKRKGFKLEYILFAIAFAGFFLFGGSKSKMWFPSTDPNLILLHDNGTVISNDTVHLAFTPSPILPLSAELYLEFRSQGSTNAAEWTLFKMGTLADFPNPYDFTYPGAADLYEWMLYTTWTPGPTVHTNGVWQVDWQTAARAEDWTPIVPLRTRVEICPHSASDYIQDGLVAMWDGIENVGWGAHDDAARVWKDLVGSLDLTLPGNLSQIYFTSNSLYASMGVRASLDNPKLIEGAITLEACWSRDSKMFASADSMLRYGNCLLDVFNGNFWARTGSDGGIMAPINDRAAEGVPFTLSVVGSMNGAWNTLTAFVNATRIDNGSRYNVKSEWPSVNIGSSYNNPVSTHYNMRVYNRVLTEEEILHNYNIDKERFNLP